jgi:serine/threonine protein kinase
MPPAGQTGANSAYRIGKYRILGRVGRGGMGVVYRAFDETLEREVALKVLALEANIDRESRQRFAIEAKAAAKLQHPNIVTVYELGEERGIPFIAMELLSGVDVDMLLRSEEALLLEESLDVMAQVCRGLAYAHSRRIVHRDIKPSNIRILDNGTSKILDFGIAKLGELTLTQSGTVLGTVHYMSPEQVHGLPLDGRSDVFSAGVILYEMCTKRRPFTGRTATEILDGILHSSVPPLPRALLSRAPRLQAVLDQALAKNVADRYPSADALADDLTALRAEVIQTGGSYDSTEATTLVNRAEKFMKDGRFDETIVDLSSYVTQNPNCLVARRMLRAARRERTQRQTAVEDGFPELLSTFGPMLETRDKATLTLATPAPRSQVGGRSMLLLGASLLVAAISAAVLLFTNAPRRSTGDDVTGSRTVTTQPTVAMPQPSRPVRGGASDTLKTLRIVSNPSGAAILLNGVAVDGVTPLSIEVDMSQAQRLELRLAGYAPHKTIISASAPIREELHFDLRPIMPLTAVVVASSYPIDLLWNDRIMARRQTSPRIEIPRGRHALRIEASEYFLRTDVVVDVADTPLSVSAPALGRLNVRANPDNCDIYIDGVFADNPPMHGRLIASGAHVVEFRWPDGFRTRKTVDVTAGGVSYVFGRREENP